jgi:hypothetical protein
MFSAYVAATAFVLTSFVTVALIVFELFVRSDLDRGITNYDLTKLAILFAVWFISGFYLWG